MEDLNQTPAQQASQSIEQLPTPPTQNKPRNSITFIFVFVLISSLIAFLIGGYILGQKGKSSKQVACTQEAKICPDGTSVGRTGPNCDFSPCPSPKPARDETANWKTYASTKYGYSIKYPEESVLLNKYLEEGKTFSLQYCPGLKEHGENWCGAPGRDYLAIYIAENPEEKSLNEVLQNTYSFKIPSCIQNDPQTKTQKQMFQGRESIFYDFLLDKKAYETFCKGEAVPYDYNKRVVVSNKKYIVVLAIVNSSFEARNKLDQILSTFRFTN